MKKQTLTKIISGLIVFVFVVSMFQFTLPAQAANSMANFYSNPNNGDNTYKFKIKDVVNSNLLTNIVGCTGVVNKVATWMATILQSKEQVAKKALDEITKYRNLAKQSCGMVKGATQTAAGAAPLINNGTTGMTTIMESANIAGGIGSIGVSSLGTTKLDTGLAGIKPAETAGLTSTEKTCVDSVNVMSDDMVTKLVEIQKQDQADNLKTQCFDGIAITLAKNQLSAMTRSAMNWVNSGYGGNPFFVQNMTNLTNSIGNNVINTGIDALLSPLAPQNPYARDFMTSTIRTQGLRSSSTKFLGGLTSDLENFISNPVSYYSDATLTDADRARIAIQRSKDANNAFAKDFSTGGWNGWLALTQTPQNNPLGFNMVASQYLADVQSQEVSKTQSELTQNNGFLSQKECIKWQMYTEDAKPQMVKGVNVGTTGLAQGYVPVYSNTKPKYQVPDSVNKYGKCVDWKITTPGSIIRDKTTNYLNSPERQLELAKTINDSLNALFSILISKLEGGGLSGLSDNASNTSNWIDSINSIDNFTSPDGNTPYNNNGAYDGFNLTRDLGNNYIYGDPIDLGTWNATTNEATNTFYPETPSISNVKVKTIKLYPGTPPENYQTNDKTKVIEQVFPINAFYKVKPAGNTNLMIEGYNGWAEGDRAFWDGSAWQNWKAGQANPIKKRGVIQIQQDYIVAAKEILKVLPGVMPKLGELDYCIPGPNPNYQINSIDAQSAYQSWAGTMYSGPLPSSSAEQVIGYKMDSQGSRTFETFHSIFNDVPYAWKHVLATNPLAGMLKEWGGVHSKTDGGDSIGGPFLQDITERMNANLDYINNYQFVNFYEIFDTLMNKHYFDKMTSKFINTETSIDQPGNENKAYIPMATAGFDLTKNIVSYSDDITKATSDYTDAINQAKLNIAKLEPIRDEVSQIIQAAQDRRNAAIIANIKKKNGNDTEPTAKEISDFKTTYASCLAEENISFYDPEQLTKGGEAGSCSDSIDNDGNGLVDCKDPTCNSDPVCKQTVTVTATPPSINPGGTSMISWTSTNTKDCTLSGGPITRQGNVNGTTNPGVSTGQLTTTTTYTVSCTGLTNLKTSGNVVVSVGVGLGDNGSCKSNSTKLRSTGDLTQIFDCASINDSTKCNNSYDMGLYKCIWNQDGSGGRSGIGGRR